MENTLSSTLNGLTSAVQALALQIRSINTPNSQPASSNTLPSQPFPNPKGGINAITLRSGTTLQERSYEEPCSRENIQVKDAVEVEDAEEEDEVQDMVEEAATQPENGASKAAEASRDAIPIPFPHLARKSRKQMELDPKMVEIFKKVEVTIPLFDAIQQVPKYANDPGPCIVSCTIEGVTIFDCMCDIGACVSIMPLSVYDALMLPPLKRSATRFVLADKSIISVVGIAEDVLMSIKGLIFPIDFYILEMPPNDSGRQSSILLGRPFLKTSKFKLDAFSGTYSFEIDGRTVSFNLDEAMRHPMEDHSIFQCDIIDENMAVVHQEEIEEMHMEQVASVGKPSELSEDVIPPHIAPDDQVPSQEQKTELKPLPPHLKYAYWCTEL
ncbi:uncharacterized protein LOC107465847 [Arachis duranensis]|uniref:Uncharacterized protein LOC107465847 n=1 Tax=Arachis duranensis TaxID=130453 RepID=A0A6P4C5R8_ARADU|nr:uncharacterized protein LOC107465847 [Arachis duranensis]